MKHRTLILALLIGLAAATTGCQKEEGPMEKAGKAIDDAAEDVQDAAEDAKDEVEDAAEDVKDEVEDATGNG
jgi:uncharacterized protein YjbJ (UPF0337 family)